MGFEGGLHRRQIVGSYVLLYEEVYEIKYEAAVLCIMFARMKAMKRAAEEGGRTKEVRFDYHGSNLCFERGLLVSLSWILSSWIDTARFQVPTMLWNGILVGQMKNEYEEDSALSFPLLLRG